MRSVAGILLGLLALFVGAAWLLAASVRSSAAAYGLHRWVFLPVACADARCVTYARWAGVVQAAGETAAPADLLTEFLVSRATSLVARRTGLSIADEELFAALAALEETASAPALRVYLAGHYGPLDRPLVRDGIRDLLLRQKLRAAGIDNVWAHPASPTVTLLSFRYHWDAASGRVVEQ